MGIEKQRGAGDRAGNPCVEIACIAIDPRASVVLVRLDPELGQNIATEINRSALFPGGVESLASARNSSSAVFTR